MKLSLMNELNTSRDMIDVFKGYNHNPRISEGEFYDMKNLTSTNYPILSPRSKRGVFANVENPQGLISKDSLCYVDGADFYINGYKVEMELSTKAKDCPKTLISMGAYVIIMPDKKWVKTIANQDDKTVFEHGSIEAEWKHSEYKGDITFEMSKVDGTQYENVTTSKTAPEITEGMKNGTEDIPLWLDKSSYPYSLKQYSTSSAMWSTIPTTYIKISATGIGKPFEVGDGVMLKGHIIDGKLRDLLDTTMIIQAKEDDYIVVIGIYDAASTQTYIEGRLILPYRSFHLESSINETQ